MPSKEPAKEKVPKVLDVEEEPEPKSPKSRGGPRSGFDGSGNSETGGGFGSNRSEAGDDLAIWHEEQEDEHVRSLYKAEKLLDDVLYRQNMYEEIISLARPDAMYNYGVGCNFSGNTLQEHSSRRFHDAL